MKGELIMNLTKAHKILLSSSLSVFLVGCSGAPNYSQSEMHMTVEEVDSQKPIKPKKIPSLVKASPTATALSRVEESDTFDVSVTGAPVRDLLFALARDAGVNMDIDDKIGGFVSINALDQTLNAILARISEQVDIRIEYLGDAIIIKPDDAYYKQYQIDYLSITREFDSSIDSGSVGDIGSASINNEGETDFWSSLESVMESLVVETRIEGGDESGLVAAAKDSGRSESISESERIVENDNFFNINRDVGLLLVYAPGKVQKEVQKYLDATSLISKRQVLLEATIVEVVLNNQYAQGIDWSLFNALAEEGLGLYQGGLAGGAAAALNIISKAVDYSFTGSFSSSAEAFTYVEEVRSQYEDNPYAEILSFEYEVDEESGFFVPTIDVSVEELHENATKRSGGGIRPSATSTNDFFSAAYRQGDLSAAVQLLDQFGDSKVLSSPRISALNNQPAVLKVVDQEVYFNFSIDDEINPDSGQVIGRSVNVEEQVVDVGIILNILPNISANGEIMLNLKPTVTRVIDYREVPSIIAGGSSESSVGQNFVPITRVRELESLISLRDGEVAVLGGLLEDRTTDSTTGVPGLSSLPGIGALFENKDQTTFKTEFVVFLRAKIIKNPSLNGDYSDYRSLLPNSDFVIRDTEGALFVRDQEEVR